MTALLTVAVARSTLLPGDVSITGFLPRMTMDGKDMYSCFIRLHILHHACREPVFGIGIIEELAGHGYRLSPGTLYPLLHGLEEKGYLRSSEDNDGGRPRRVYRATAKGRKALAVAKVEVRELFSELLDEKNPEDGSRRKAVVTGDLIREIAAQLINLTQEVRCERFQNWFGRR